MAASSSSSSFSYRFTYDVFLSFRGPDTRRGFTGHLFKALKDKGIHTFLDDEELRGGEEITPSLREAIGQSRIAIVVLSKNYASSSFCLDELSFILECIKQNGRLVLPVFYDVDPSVIRHQIGTYSEALANHGKRFKDNMEKVQNWRKALRQVANLSGRHFKQHGDGYEYEFIGKIVDEVSRKINRVPLLVANYPVGLESQVLQVKSLLDVGSDDGVHMVGIHGIGGIGKTTLALAVYNFIADNFEGLCFLENVREKSNKHGLEHLQKILLSEILGGKKIKLASGRQGISMIQHRLQPKKVLLILDDVDKREQLEFLVGRSDWFGSGSRVIITSRDKHLLECHGVQTTYEVEGLNETEALELLRWKAFKTDKVDPSYMDVLNCVVAYASGLPLALEVIGSYLFGKSKEEWNSALEQYKRIPNKEIQKILEVSFDALEEGEQKIFLDIACCFKGYELAEVEGILCAHHGVCPKYGIRVLVEKSLIRINPFGEVTLHDLIQDMGREIVRQESPEKPGKRSRLWFPEDIVQVLEDNKGSSKIQIIILDFPKSEEEVVEWDGKAFKKMESLKTLIIGNGRFSQGPKHLPNSLRVLEWWGYPSPSLPSDFHPKKLAILKLPNSLLMSLKFPEKQKKVVNLKVLDLTCSEYITEIPDVSGVPNLEKLLLSECENLIKIHESVGFLDKLRVLDADHCRKLRTFPPIKLTFLERLKLSFCSSLESFPKILGKMENITELYLEHTPIKELPISIQNLTRLQNFELHGCEMFQLPSSSFMLQELNKLNFDRCDGFVLPKQDEGGEQVGSMGCLTLFSCNISDEFLRIGLTLFPNVKELDLSHSNFTILPACIKECLFLRKLALDHCKNLQEIRGIPPNLEIFYARLCRSLKDLDLTLLPASTKECHFLRVLILDCCESLGEIRGMPPNLECFSALDCISLTSLCRRMLLNEKLHEKAGYEWFCLPGATIPEWFKHRSQGRSICFWFRKKFPVIALCVVAGGSNPIIFDICAKLIIDGNITVKGFQNELFCYSKVNHMFIFGEQQTKFKANVDRVHLENEWNHVVISIDILDLGKRLVDPFVMEIGLHVFKQKGSMEDIRFTDPYKRRKLDHDLITLESENYLLLKEEHRVDKEVSQIQFMQQQQNWASLRQHVGQGREWLPLLPPPAMNSLNDEMNWDSNSMESKQISSSTSVQDCSGSIKRTGVYVNQTSTSMEDVLFTNPAPPKNTYNQSCYSNDGMGNQLTMLDNGLFEAPDIQLQQQFALFNPTIPMGCETVEYSQVDSTIHYEMSDWLSMPSCWEQLLDYMYCNSDSVEMARTIDGTNDLDQAVLGHSEEAPGGSSQAPGFAEAQNIHRP